MIGICAAAPVLATPQADFSVDVKVVNMVSVVRDKQGRYVADHTLEDFAVEEDGHPQHITYFQTHNDLPLTLGLLVDTSGSQARVLEHERAASVVFFNQVLRDIDRAFLAKFDAGLKMFRELTASRAELEDGLGEIVADVTGKPPPMGTVLFDAVYKSANVVMKRVEGRHAVILLTDGVDTSSLRSEGMAIEACLRTDTLIYSV